VANEQNPNVPSEPVEGASAVDPIAGDVAALVHDLRNVLSAIRGFATVIGEDLPAGVPALDDIAQILKAVDHGAEISTRLTALRSRVAPRPSTPAGGSAPVPVDQEVERSASWSLPQPRQLGTLLVVEDDDLVRMMTVRVLRRSGYTIIEAPDADEAEEKAQANGVPVDLLLSDVGLPSTGGPALAARLLERWPTLKVLYMSGLGRATLAAQGVVVGPAFLEKPFAPRTLLERIDALLAPGTT
jgi:CheY-like chemotaxis protein